MTTSRADDTTPAASEILTDPTARPQSIDEGASGVSSFPALRAREIGRYVDCTFVRAQAVAREN